MLSFKTFLYESLISTNAPKKRLNHLDHIEDSHIIGEKFVTQNRAGEEETKTDYNAGYQNAKRTLEGVHNVLKGKKDPNIAVSEKIDGSPSMIFGYHPESKRFFVSTKTGLFNKEPKINYTEDDVDRNHGNSPELARIMKAALHHLPKITPPGAILQGDHLYSKDNDQQPNERSLQSQNRAFHFKPNTITYSVKHTDPEAQKIKQSKFGISVYARYHGDNVNNLGVELNPNLSDLREHPDVHTMSNNLDLRQATHTPDSRDSFEEHMRAADEAHSAANGYEHHEGHDHENELQTYINSTVRNNTTPTTDGYRAHRVKRMTEKIDALKTEKAKEQKRQQMQDTLDHIDQHKEHFDSTFAVHRHLQAAKNSLLSSFDTIPDGSYHKTIDGKKASREGIVVTYKGKGGSPGENDSNFKFVDRGVFSAANFAQSANRKNKTVEAPEVNK